MQAPPPLGCAFDRQGWSPPQLACAASRAWCADNQRRKGHILLALRTPPGGCRVWCWAGFRGWLRACFRGCSC
jgi:hypothetical protein